VDAKTKASKPKVKGDMDIDAKVPKVNVKGDIDAKMKVKKPKGKGTGMFGDITLDFDTQVGTPIEKFDFNEPQVTVEVEFEVETQSRVPRAKRLGGTIVETGVNELCEKEAEPAKFCYVVISHEIVALRRQSMFKIRSQYSTGEPASGYLFTVNIVGPKNINIPNVVTDKGDGTYEVVFKPKHTGILDISVLLDGIQVNGSPFTLFGVPENTVTCTAHGKGISKGSVNEKLEFQLETNFRGLLQHTNVPTEALECIFTGPDEVKYETCSTSPGCFTICYVVKTPGTYGIVAKLFGSTLVDTTVEIGIKTKYDNV